MAVNFILITIIIIINNDNMPCGVGYNKRIAPMYSLRVVKGDYKGRGEGTENPLLLCKIPQRQHENGIYEVTQVVEDGGGWVMLLQQRHPNSAGSLVTDRTTE